MSAEKTDLARAGTMQVTAKEGKAFLDKNLTEWKKPYLMDGENQEEDEVEEEENDSSPVKKPKLAKHSTMKGTAKEAAGYLEAHGKPDQDALTRGQQKKINDIQSEAPSPKKARMARDNTMASTAKEGRALVGDKLEGTRGETKSKKKGRVGRSTTMTQVAEEAKLLYGDLPATEGRSLRKRSAPPPPKVAPKKKSAGPGKGSGKRGRPKKVAEPKEEEVEENNKASEDGEDAEDGDEE